MNDQLNNGSVREGSQASSLNYSTGIIGRILNSQSNSRTPKGFALVILLVQFLVILTAIFSVIFLEASLDGDNNFLVSSKQIYQHLLTLDRDMRKILSAVQRISVVESEVSKVTDNSGHPNYSTSFMTFLNYTRTR